MLDMFDSPWISIFFGCFFLVLGYFRGRRRPPGSLSAGTGRIMFGIVGLLMLCNGFYQLWRS